MGFCLMWLIISLMKRFDFFLIGFCIIVHKDKFNLNIYHYELIEFWIIVVNHMLDLKFRSLVQKYNFLQ